MSRPRLIAIVPVGEPAAAHPHRRMLLAAALFGAVIVGAAAGLISARPLP